MPKSKVRKKAVYTPPANDRKPVKIKGPTHPAYVAIMLGVGLLGLAWLITDYLARDAIPFMQALGGANFLVGFGLIVIALLMSMRWR
ncbi:cell division protein CrgA [Pseudonocardia halophobica]|uniref:cell division protein CrgA n=1 Tax=Pseudonocardia halophobica TaxID=29401 RepID=UPI003D93784A